MRWKNPLEMCFFGNTSDKMWMIACVRNDFEIMVAKRLCEMGPYRLIQN